MIWTLRFLAITLGALLTVVATVWLGLWQLDRAHQKQDLQAAVHAQGEKMPLSGTQLHAAGLAPTALLHQRALLRGTWAARNTIFLDNRQMNNRVGFYVLTPLLLEGGGAIVVQRGWLPRNFEVRTALPALETPTGLVEVQGRMALPPSKLFEPGQGALGAIRQNVDLVQFAAETGLQLMPVTLLQSGAPSEGLLRDWPAVNLGVDKHYGYAFQWFALATLVAGLYLWFQIIRRFIHRSKDTTFHA